MGLTQFETDIIYQKKKKKIKSSIIQAYMTAT